MKRIKKRKKLERLHKSQKLFMRDVFKDRAKETKKVKMFLKSRGTKGRVL